MDDQELERVVTPMTKELVERINDWRFEHRADSRSDAVRQLVLAGLEATSRGKKKA